MRRLLGATLAVIACVVLAFAATEVRREYFQQKREVRIERPDRQSYIVVDADIWQHTRRDLGDVRIYDQNGSETPYALQTESGGTSHVFSPVKLLDVGSVGSTTEFKLDAWADANSPAEYDTVKLDLTARNFITRALVEGEDDPSALAWTRLGDATIFDFSRENLGRNFDVKLRAPSRFHYLRVRIPGRVQPEEVLGASITSTVEASAVSDTVPGKVSISNQGKDTVITWEQGEMPLERIRFEISGRDNFSRRIELQNADGYVVATDEIARVHLNRGGQRADREDLSISMTPQYSPRFKLIVHNGDDRPLPIERVVPTFFQRRLYLQPQPSMTFSLYYGDKEVGRPTYDFDKWFRRDPDARPVELSAPQRNPEYKARPDTRPWSDRHQWVLWAALVIAVFGLGALAIRGMKK